jgi:hypothetical protein
VVNFFVSWCTQWLGELGFGKVSKELARQGLGMAWARRLLRDCD